MLPSGGATLFSAALETERLRFFPVFGLGAMTAFGFGPGLLARADTAGVDAFF
jgi:hypothetical protein